MSQLLSDFSTPLTVVVIEGRATSRAGLRMVLETEPSVHVVGETSTIAEGLHLAENHRPHIIVLDLDLARPHALSTIRRLVAQSPESAVLLLALFVDPLTCSELLAAGAAGCVEKDIPDNFLKAFRSIRHRSSYAE